MSSHAPRCRQTFPKLLTVARGPATTRTGDEDNASSSSDEDTAEQQATTTDATAGGSGGGSANSRVPALLALMRLVRGAPLEALSQQQRDTAVSAVVQALRSDYEPLQAEALETFQVRPAVKTLASFRFCFLRGTGVVFSRINSHKAPDTGIFFLSLSLSLFFFFLIRCMRSRFCPWASGVGAAALTAAAFSSVCRSLALTEGPSWVPG